MPNTDTLPPAVARNPDSVATLKSLGWSTAIAVGIASAQIVAEALPNLVQVTIPLLPGWGQMVGPALLLGATGLQTWLLKQAKRQHKDAVVEALNTEPPGSSDPNDIKRMYRQ